MYLAKAQIRKVTSQLESRPEMYCNQYVNSLSPDQKGTVTNMQHSLSLDQKGTVTHMKTDEVQIR